MDIVEGIRGNIIKRIVKDSPNCRFRTRVREYLLDEEGLGEHGPVEGARGQQLLDVGAHPGAAQTQPPVLQVLLQTHHLLTHLGGQVLPVQHLD